MRATRAIIRLDNLRHNIRILAAHTKNKKICVAVKADAYGHGAVAVSRAALSEGVSCLGVATVDEGRELREAGIGAPMLLYSLPLPEEIPDVVSLELTPFVADETLAGFLSREAHKQGKKLCVHIKVDTGMGRIGCRPDQVLALASLICSSGSLVLEGLATHFPVSDSSDPTFTDRQVATMNEAITTLKKKGIGLALVHAANSGAIVDKPGSWFDLVRPGIILYGYYPSSEQKRPLAVKPVMELVTKIVFIKKVPAGTGISYGLTHTTTAETYIATLPVGYADGYSRLLSNRACVNIGGTRYPVVGRVCMDQTMIDLGPAPNVKLYDEATLFGAAPGGPDAEEIARLVGTIPYEVTCLITKRVPRVFINGTG